MELDNLKEFWNKDNQNLPEVSLEKQDEIYSPLEMIKINMRTEFWLLIITMPLLLYGFPFNNGDINIKTIASFEVLLTLSFIIYFYSRFIKLYKMLRSTGINTNYDLFNIKTQLLVSKEIYISYYICYIPMALLICLIDANFKLDNVYYITIFSLSLLISILIVFIIIKFWIYHMYGKHIEEVIQIIDDLNGVKNDKPTIKKLTWFETSQSFFRAKYGVKGHVFNTVLWFFSSYVVIIIILSIFFIIIILLGIWMNIIDETALFEALGN